MSVRAKFTVASKTETKEGFSVKMMPVYGDDNPENKLFYRYTPGGSIEMSIVNPPAAEQLQVGKSYYVDFTEAE